MAIHLLTAVIRKIRFISMFNHQRNKHRGLEFVKGGFQYHNFAVFFSFYDRCFYYAFKMFNYSKGRCKIYNWWFYFCFYGFNFSGGGEMMVGSWDPSHPSLPHHHSLASNHRSPAQAVDKAFPSSSIWLPGRGKRPWITSEPPLALSRGKRAEGLSGMLCPCPTYIFLWGDVNAPPQTPLLAASTCLCFLLPSNKCISKFLNWKSVPHKPHLSPHRMAQRDEPVHLRMRTRMLHHQKPAWCVT